MERARGGKRKRGRRVGGRRGSKGIIHLSEDKIFERYVSLNFLNSKHKEGGFAPGQVRDVGEIEMCGACLGGDPDRFRNFVRNFK